MKRQGLMFIFAIAAILLAAGACFGEKATTPDGMLVLQGKVLDSAGMPLSDANVVPFLNGKPFMPAAHGAETPKEYSTGRNGLFMIEIPAPVEKIKDGKWSLKITRPSFKPTQNDSCESPGRGEGRKRHSSFCFRNYGISCAVPGGGILDSLDSLPRCLRPYSFRDPPPDLGRICRRGCAVGYHPHLRPLRRSVQNHYV